MKIKRMKHLNWKFPLILLVVFTVSSAEAVKVKPIDETTPVINNKITSAVTTTSPSELTKESKKISRKRQRIQRKMQRLQRKVTKLANSAKRFFGGATDNTKFRIGILSLIVGLGLVVVVNVIGLGWIFGLLGGLAAITGICLMIWGVLEYTN